MKRFVKIQRQITVRSPGPTDQKWAISISGPKYSGLKKPKQTSPFDFRPNFQEFLV